MGIIPYEVDARSHIDQLPISKVRSGLDQFDSQPRSREEHGIELRSDQHNKRNHIHPHQQRYANSQGAVEDAVIGVALQIPTKQGRSPEP